MFQWQQDYREGMESLMLLEAVSLFVYFQCSPGYYDVFNTQKQVQTFGTHAWLSSQRGEASKSEFCTGGRKTVEVRLALDSWSPAGRHTAHWDWDQVRRALVLGTGCRQKRGCNLALPTVLVCEEPGAKPLTDDLLLGWVLCVAEQLPPKSVPDIRVCKINVR